MRPKALRLGFVLLLAAPSFAADVSVKYRSASHVYLDDGAAAGLAVGDRLRVVSSAATVAELEVVFVAEHSASCKVLSETRPVKPGDVVVAVPRAGSPAPPTAPAFGPTPDPRAIAAPPPAPSATPAPAAPFARLRGSASLGYYRSVDQSDWGFDFEERTARLDLSATQITGRAVSFTLRSRSRQDIRARTLSSRTPKSERADRLYEAALRYEPASDDLSVEIGRIGVSRFVSIGYLDGALGRYRLAGGVRVGAFGGKMADIEGIGFDGKGRKYGAFLQFAPRGRYSTSGAEALIAYVRENVSGEVSREYLSLESRFGGSGRWWLSERAELELNRGWREEMAGRSFDLSNVSVTLNARLSRSSSGFVSYDGRRNYRYFRNRTLPEEVFDDLLQQGLRAGLNLARPGGLGARASVGLSLKEKDPRHPELDLANAYSGSFGAWHSNAFGAGLSVGVDGTGFSNGYTEGGLVTGRVGRVFAAGHSLELSYSRSLYHVLQTEENRTTEYLRLVGRGALGRRFYVLGDLEYDRGDDLEGPRAFVEVGVLF